MDKIKQNAYAKINLGLDVVRRLENGYHEVSMIMQTVSLCDKITICKNSGHGIEVFTNKAELPGDENNLVYKAAALLCDEFKIEDAIMIELEKNIPIAAGLAGGSSDAAAVFRGMNELFSLKLSIEDMQNRAVKLGADIPYCITGGTYLSEGIGEKLSQIKSFDDYYVLLAKPDISVSTKWVYENLNLSSINKHPSIAEIKTAIENGNLNGMCEKLENILESVTVTKYPVIDEIKAVMKSEGALSSLMSGSGPTVFGIFDDIERIKTCKNKIEELKLAKDICITQPVINPYSI